MIPYPDSERALRSVRRRRDAYLRALYLNYPRRCALGISNETGWNDSFPAVTSADVLRPVLDHIAERTTHYEAFYRPPFERVFLNTVITELDTPTISTA